MPALIPIDIQDGLRAHPYWGGAPNNPKFEENVAALFAAARAYGAPLRHVKHNSVHAESPLRPGQPGNAFRAVAEPRDGEAVFEKSVNSAFIGTGLEAHLRAAGETHLVMFGLTTEHCVSTSVRMAANLGFQVTVVGDACAAFPKTGLDGAVIDADAVHAVNLASLSGEFATVVSTIDAVAGLKAGAVELANG